MHSTDNANIIRKHILAQGQVQGVGFRPFVYKLATLHSLTGYVGNTSQGVCIEVQGIHEDIEYFLLDLQAQLPPLAKLTSFVVSTVPIKSDETNFQIITSHGAGSHAVLISADTSICNDCQQDIFDLKNRRHNYAFTNCTNCGPRYTITHSIPYDRATTSMACFPLCHKCKQEYENPLDRRFHAQPNACPLCGPKMWFVASESEQSRQNTTYTATPEHLQDDNALKALAKSLKQGQLAAIKGLGGFHLSCDANNKVALELLRKRKNRPHKPFAVMVQDLEMAKRVAHISPEHETLLLSAERPIVLCPKKANTLPDCIAPDADSIGLVLPYTPLHLVLFKYYTALFKPQDTVALVMTSGNAGGEPICLGNREALKRLKHIAHVFLLHNRDILVRTDDPVCNIPKNIDEIKPQKRIVFLRRARGYVPRPIKICSQSHHEFSVLGMGAELKSTICLTRGSMAFISQHIGDLQNVETLGFYNEVIKHLEMLLQVSPKALVHDLHPDFMSTHVAKDMAKYRNIPCFALQHHFAHAWSVLAEHNFIGKALALTLDGTGLGPDNTIWGGELLYINTENLKHKRLGHVSQFALAGGDIATREPWRIALALARGTEFESKLLSAQEKFGPAVLEMLNRQVNCPKTSSVGRLFDAVAAGLGLCTQTTYEGQAAIRLEYAQNQVAWTGKGAINAGYPCVPIKNELWQLPAQELFLAALAEDNISLAARRFHVGLAQGFVSMAQQAAEEVGTNVVALSGGAMQNSTLQTLLPHLLQKAGLQVLMHKDAPANDGGISLGQAAWGLRKLKL